MDVHESCSNNKSIIFGSNKIEALKSVGGLSMNEPLRVLVHGTNYSTVCPCECIEKLISNECMTTASFFLPQEERTSWIKAIETTHRTPHHSDQFVMKANQGNDNISPILSIKINII